ncbi:MAG: (Fe-S)-binding protein [Candidatus Thorarchaeota archaeon]
MRISDYRDMIYACGRCNFCHGADFDERCPELYTQYWESSTARGRMAIARGILEGKINYTPDLAERIFGCFLCARCREECKKAANIDVIAITRAMRADFVDMGVQIPDGARTMIQNLTQSRNIFADRPTEYLRWSRGIDFEEGSGTLFYPGCLASHRFKEKTNILVQVLQSAGIRLDSLGEDQRCCGTPFWVTGSLREARQWASDFTELLKSRKVKEVITPCPSCFRALEEEHPRLLGLSSPAFRVRHASEVLESLLRTRRLRPKIPVDKVVTYHDPCEIGRYRGVYDQPRQVLLSIPGVRLVEMARSRSDAFCCGGGGGVKIMYEDNSQRVASRRLEEAVATGAEIVATCCPACELNLTHAVYGAGASMRVLDIAEMLAVSCGIVSGEILEPDYIPED